MSIFIRSKSAAATLAVVTLPLPLHAVHGSHRALHRHRAKPAPAGAQRRPAHKGRHLKLQFPAGGNHPASGNRQSAHAAGDPGDTISDYKYTPGTLTINVGDTVTWVNDGPSAHTATATNGSFNTGLLSKGSSGSHTFTQAGTFHYFCTIHPFMKGVIIVLAAKKKGSGGGSGGSGSSSGTPSAGTTPTMSSTNPATQTSSGPTLPNTGTDVGLMALVGIALACGGLGIRRLRRAP